MFRDRLSSSCLNSNTTVGKLIRIYRDLHDGCDHRRRDRKRKTL